MLIADTPKVMTEGNWRLGVYVDDQASDEQFDKLVQVFGGQLVKGGAILVRQRGTPIHPGLGVGRGGDDTLFAATPGKVRYHERRGRHFVSIDA